MTAELGDYEPDEHSPYTVSEFRFVPEQQQTEELELAVLEQFKTLRCVSTVPAAGARTLATAKRLV